MLRINGKTRSALTRSILVLAPLLSSCRSDHKLKTNEAILRQDLYQMRSAIDQYTQDKGKSPQHLHDLITTEYLHAIPKDPFTNSSDTWVEIRDDTLGTISKTQPGLADVRSGSDRISSEGTRYSTW
jgi:general secretion pathway protein G